MCTLIAAVRSFEGFPLVVASNRDERLDRPATPPGRRAGEDFLAPRDEEAGGTWLGLSRRGLFVGVTNRFGVERDGGRESRGALVVEALGNPSASALHQALAAQSPARFNAFHLFYADRTTAHVTWSDGRALHQETLASGLHVITERSLGQDDHARTERIRGLWAGLSRASPPSLEELAGLLRAHDESDPTSGVCVHLDGLGYGTRSSFVLHLADEPSASRLWWTEGAPCRHPLVSGEELLAQLL